MAHPRTALADATDSASGPDDPRGERSDAPLDLDPGLPGGGPPARDRPHLFGTVLRGYDRRQVDQHIEELLAKVESGRQRAVALEEQLQQQSAARPPEAHHGFGERVEKLLRMAEREAAEMRTTAGENAAAVLEQARNQAKAYQRDVTQALAAKRTEAAQYAEQLQMSLSAHQEAITGEIASARGEAAEILADAEREAARIIEQAQAQARDTRVAVERAAGEYQQRARIELGRLVTTRDGVCAELARLQELVADVLTNFGEIPRRRHAPGQQPTTIVSLGSSENKNVG